ncbi:hypothetical protein [Streptomyces sp. TLI_105]|uniref:hypothetical protein n=1 Tax=Streptomyces sp. TLI_105 TaxID=1881019 RepID=UPI0008966AD7|nr:hypothetical protein [Streptomyces sp. TLI_105]SED50123.1 hypothetical protein SAMN05428939_5374 [Streptomyces sp. TLI_105]
MSSNEAPPKQVRSGQDAEVTGKHLDDVAKILAGAFVAVTGVMTGLGLGSERVFIALNNSSNALWIALGLTFAAFALSIAALFIPRNEKGIVWETVVLALGVAAFIGAMSVAVAGAAEAANGSGRATITNLKIEGKRPDLTLTFDVRADGVQKDRRLTAFVHPSNLVDSKFSSFDPAEAFYIGTLRPDDKSVVDQKVSIPFTPGKFTHLAVYIATSDNIQDKKEDAAGAGPCDVDNDKGPACAFLRVP